MLNPFRWKPNREIDAFSRELARELAERCTAEMAARPAGKKGQKKLGRALDRIYSRARQYCREHRLGVYGTARLGNTFKWELREMGYDGAFVEEATKGLILSMRGK